LGSFGVGVYGALDQAAFVRTEVAAGIAPPIPNTEPEETITAELLPGYGLRERSERSSFVLRLLPRVYFRHPDLGDVDRPLVLARAGAESSYRVTELLTWNSSANAAFGELDYASTRLAFASPVARNLSDPVVDVRAADGQTALSWRATETYTLDVAALGAYTVLSGDSELNLPTSTMVGLDVAQRWQLDPVSTLTVPVSPRYYDVTNDRNTASVSLQAVYARQLSLRDSLTASAGATLLREEGYDPEVLPRAVLSLDTVAYQSPGLRLTNSIHAGVDVLFDPALGELRPIALLSWSERAEIGTRWTVTVTAQGFTSADPDPLSGSAEADALAEQGETEFGGSLVAAHRANAWLRLDFGVRGSTRASHWASDDFEFIDEQIWVFTGVTLLFGLGTAETPDWLR
jgi:hypothetical protein